MTGHVCYPCAKLIANSGIERVVVRTNEDAVHRDPLRSYRFLSHCGLSVDVETLSGAVDAFVYHGTTL